MFSEFFNQKQFLQIGSIQQMTIGDTKFWTTWKFFFRSFSTVYESNFEIWLNMSWYFLSLLTIFSIVFVETWFDTIFKVFRGNLPVLETYQLFSTQLTVIVNTAYFMLRLWFLYDANSKFIQKNHFPESNNEGLLLQQTLLFWYSNHYLWPQFSSIQVYRLFFWQSYRLFNLFLRPFRICRIVPELFCQFQN